MLNFLAAESHAMQTLTTCVRQWGGFTVHEYKSNCISAYKRTLKPRIGNAQQIPVFSGIL